MTIKRITLLQAQYVAHALATELMNSIDEPIPPFETVDKGKLESCLAEPFQTFDGKFLHFTFIERAAVLFYLVTKNHCFDNGNKRMAVTLTTTFFYTNKRWLEVSSRALYEIACDVAESKPSDREAMQKALTIFFKKNTKPLGKDI